MKKGMIIIFICLILLTSLVSAGIFDAFKKITGYASSQTVNVSVSVSGANPAYIPAVSEISAQDPTEDSSKVIHFNFTICDPDGESDIDQTSGQANFSKASETTRYNTSCVYEGQLNATCGSFACNITMWYWDGSGTWNVAVNGTDKGAQTVVFNSSTTFTYNELRAMVITPDNVTWSGITPGGTNQTADNDPVTVNNTGNYDGTINMTGIDLHGATIDTEIFGVDNFTVDVETGGSPAAECDGTYLVNDTTTSISNTDTNPGNLSAGGGAGQETLYYCIPDVPLLSTQEYTTSKAGNWTITYDV
jgi:hypothetical protein